MKQPRRDPTIIREYREEHWTCAVCGIPETACSLYRLCDRLTNHHIIRGVGRVDIPENLLRLCILCHNARDNCAAGSFVHWQGKAYPHLTMGATLQAKWEVDPELYDTEILRELSASHELIRRTSIPRVYLAERARWR